MLHLQTMARMSVGPTLRSQVFSLVQQRATACSVCSALIRNAQLQKLQQQQQQQPEQTRRLKQSHQRLLVPPVRHLQQTTDVFPTKPPVKPPRPFTDFEIREGKIHWGYTGKYGVDRWADLFPECNGTSQSPVDIVTASQIPDNSLTAFTFMNFDTVEDIQWVLQNNGHSAQVTYSDGNLLVGGGGLGSRYKVVQFHFHWGANNSVGSEHTIDGQPFPMEMHIVTYNINYEDMGSAALYKDGLAVLGVFFMVDPSDNSNYTKLIRALGEVQKPDTQVQVMPVELESLMPNDKSKYSRYSGSLTTPPCSEVVTWTLFRQPVPISHNQLEAFRALNFLGKKPMVNNFRPVQALNGRQIRCNF